jgi:hypothetical protein
MADPDRVNGEREGEPEHAPPSNLHEFRIDLNGVVELSFFDELHLPWHPLAELVTNRKTARASHRTVAARTGESAD